jgi:putative hydrolase of the HAD superfamily
MLDQAVVFDGDDTLWLVEELYDDARAEAGKLITNADLDVDRWDALQREIDLQNVLQLGVKSERFPRSCVEAYRLTAMEAGVEPDDRIAEEVRWTAAQVFERRAPIVEGAIDVLAALRPDWKLALLTKGDVWVQQRRIVDAGIEDLLDQIDIVPDKGAAEFSAVLDGLGTSRERSWSVGNSLPSDINPALAVGMGAIWIEAHVWEHERRELVAGTGRLVIARRLTDVPTLLAQQ